MIVLRSDNHIEFANIEVERLLQKKGINHQTIVPYVPEQDGKSKEKREW